MSKITDLIKGEPALLTTAAGIAVGVGTHFGLHLSPDVQNEVYGGLATVSAFVIRHFVSPKSAPTKEALVADAVDAEAKTEAEVSKLSDSDRLDRVEAAVEALTSNGS